MSFRELQAHLQTCRRCVAAGHFVTPPPIVSGPETAPLMIVGQAPGRIEAHSTRLPFSGPAGQRLFGWLAQCGWSEGEFRSSQYMTAITKCYPGPAAAGRGDRVPSRAEQALCRPWLEQELALVRPQVIAPVGGLAIGRFLAGGLPLADVVGRRFVRPEDDQVLTPWARRHAPPAVQLAPLPHPSGASRWLNRPQHQALMQQALAHLARLKREIG